MNPRLLFLLAFLWLPFLSKAQQYADIRFDNLGIEAGLSQSTIYCIYQDYKGFIWICTEDGINLYDGYNFHVFRPEPGNKHSIANNLVLAIGEDSLHQLLCVSANGICRYNRSAGHFDRLLFIPGLIKNDQRIALLTSGQETLFLDDGVLYRINTLTGQVKRQQLARAGNTYTLLAVLEDNKLLLGTKDSRYTYDMNTGATMPAGRADQKVGQIINMEGNQFLLYGDGGLTFFDGHHTNKAKKIGLDKRTILTSAIFDNTGHLWLSSDNGVIYVDTGTGQYNVFNAQADNTNSLAGNMVRCLYKDRTGIIWIGTNEGGVSRVIPDKTRFAGMGYGHNNQNGLFAKEILAFSEDHDGNIWLSTSTAGINIFNPKTHTVTRCNWQTGCNFHTDTYILSQLMDDSVVWCSHKNGVDIVSTRTHKVVASPLFTNGAGIKKIYRDKSGKIWAGGRQGLYLYDKMLHKFQSYPLSIPTNYVQDMLEDPQGDLWLCLSPGLLKLQLTTGKIIDYNAKFPDLIGSNSSMFGISEDNKGAIWLGSSERGLFRYIAEKDSFMNWNMTNGLPNNSVYETIADYNNNIWMSTNYGISMFNPAKNTFTNYTTKDGLKSNEFNGGAVLKDHNNRIYFGNIAGFNSIDPTHIITNSTAPTPQITAFRVFDKAIPFQKMLSQNGTITLEQSQNYFSIDYSALDFTAPSENKYRIMLVGFDKSWRPLSTAHSVSYTNLDAGHYTFRVLAYNNDDVASAALLELPIYICPPFYKTWWFLLLLALLFASIIVSLIRLRLQNIYRKNAAGLKLSNLDRQMTEYKLQAIQAQMNPHFIFNSLNAIQSIIMQNNPLKAATYLADFSKLMRRILDNSHEQFVSLETMVETLQMYVHLEEFRFNNEFTYEFRIDDDLPMHSLKLPPMLLQPYVENAILHGLMPKEGAKNLLIHLFEADDKLHCIIEDNGIGRKELAQNKEHISRGGDLTKGIQESLNHLLNITATITYYDLKDNTGEPLGTRVEIIIPLKGM